MSAPLWAHQRRAVDFITKAWASGYPGVLAAMRMGTGKTRSALVAAYPTGAERVLVLCPKSVAPVWGKELAAVGIGAAVTDLADGPVKERARRLKDALSLSGGHLVVVNYEACFREPLAGALRGQTWDAIICDESHRCKSPGGVTSRFVARLGETTHRRLGLSGTPFTQSHLDAYGQYRFLDPRIFGTSYVTFRQTFTRPALRHEYRRPDSMFIQDRGGLIKIVPYNMDRFERLLAPTMLRIGEEVLDLPPFTAMARYCVLEDDAQDAYHQLEADFIAELEAGTVTAGNALVRILRLQQIAAGQTRTDAGVDVQVSQAKEKLLTDLLADLPVDEPLAVFGHFHHDLDVIHRVAQETGRRSLELSGRRNELAAWQAGPEAPPVLAVQDQAGSLGVSLVRARYMIYYTLPNSLVLADQSKARLLRPGQTRPVTCISLLCRRTVDEEIEHAVAARTEVVNAIIAAIARRHR